LDPALVPGGSSSGSAVAVATGEADVAYGSDTGGSIRIPSACCGTAGLKTTFGRVPLDGVWPLSPSFDTIGPMARDVAGLIIGMGLLEPGFTVDHPAPGTIGRFRLPADPAIDAAIDAALAATGWDVVDIELPGWDEATQSAGLLLVAEAWVTDRELAEHHADRISPGVLERILMGRDIDEAAQAWAKTVRARWIDELEFALHQVELIATPTLTIFPPTLDHAEDLLMARATLPVNLAGIPALSLPVPAGGARPASLQLLAPSRGEELLLAAGRVVEAAVNA
jgi:amidase